MKKSRKKSPLKNDHIPRRALADAARERITQLGLSRAAAALRVKDAASQMSRLMTGHDHEFSADRLVGFLARLGVEVTVMVQPGPKKHRYTRPIVVRMDLKAGERGRVTHGR